MADINDPEDRGIIFLSSSLTNSIYTSLKTCLTFIPLKFDSHLSKLWLPSQWALALLLMYFPSCLDFYLNPTCPQTLMNLPQTNVLFCPPLFTSLRGFPHFPFFSPEGAKEWKHLTLPPPNPQWHLQAFSPPPNQNTIASDRHWMPWTIKFHLSVSLPS